MATATAKVQTDQINKYAAHNAERAYRRAGYVEELTQTGHKLQGLCPYHAEAEPSFFIETRGEYAGTFYCFGCEAKGDIIDLYRHLQPNKMTLPEACEALGRLFNITPEPGTPTATTMVPSKPKSTKQQKPELPRLTDTVIQHIQEPLGFTFDEYPPQMQWLRDRKGVPFRAIAICNLGIAKRAHWGNEPRFAIPIPAMDGDGYVDIRGYAPGREPKMLPWESGRGGKTIYPWPWAQKWMRDQDHLVWAEGEIDALNLIGRYIPAITATCGAGAALSVELPDLTGKTIFVAGDNDRAGAKMNTKLPPRLRAAGAEEIMVVEWPDDAPDGYDVADYFVDGGTVEALIPWT